MITFFLIPLNLGLNLAAAFPVNLPTNFNPFDVPLSNNISVPTFATADVGLTLNNCPNCSPSFFNAEGISFKTVGSLATVINVCGNWINPIIASKLVIAATKPANSACSIPESFCPLNCLVSNILLLDDMSNISLSTFFSGFFTALTVQRGASTFASGIGFSIPFFGTLTSFFVSSVFNLASLFKYACLCLNKASFMASVLTFCLINLFLKNLRSLIFFA